MNLIFSIFFSFVILSSNFASRQLLEDYVNFENYKKERDHVYKIVYNYRNLDKKHRKKLLDEVHHKYHATGLALILHNVGMLRPGSLKEKVEMIPNAFFNQRKTDYFEDDVELKKEYEIDEPFAKFLEKIEKKYDHEKAHDDYYEKVVFSPEGKARKISMLMYLQETNKTDYLSNPQKAKEDKEFVSKFHSYSRPQMTHYSPEDRAQYDSYLNKYYRRIFKVFESKVKERSQEHHWHHEANKRANRSGKPRPHPPTYIANLKNLKESLPSLEQEAHNNLTSLVNSSKKSRSHHHHRRLLSFLELQSSSGLKLSSKTETLSQTLDSIGQCPIPMPPPDLDEQISEAKKNAETAVVDVEEDEAGSKTLQESIIMMIIKLIIAIVKMIIQIVISIIAGFLRQCIPPGPLTIFSCPEGAYWLENLYHPVQFDEKTFALWEKAKAFPFYYSNLLWNILKKRYTVITYYICGQGFFTLDCSILWPKCFEIAYIITNPPVMGNPLLIGLTLLDWLVLVPGDCPFCFLNCIQVMLQCDIPWEKISTCYGIFNLELPSSMGMDPSLAIFVGLSMAPPFCTYNPFILLLWILKPPPEIPDEFFPKEIPALKDFQKAVGSAIKGECKAGQSGWSQDEEGKYVQGDKEEEEEKKKQEAQDKKYARGGYYRRPDYTGPGSTATGSTSDSDDPYLRTTHPRVVPGHSYHVINWEKYLTDPDTVRTNDYLTSLQIGQGENVLSSSDISRITKDASSLALKIWNEKKENTNGPFLANWDEFKKGIIHEQLLAARTLSKAHPLQPTRIPISNEKKEQSHQAGEPGDSQKELQKVEEQGRNRYNLPEDGKDIQTVSGHFGDEGVEWSKM